MPDLYAAGNTTSDASGLSTMSANMGEGKEWSRVSDYLLDVAPRLREQCPEVGALLDRVTRTAWEQTDPVLLELVRLRIATLIGNAAGGVRSPWISAEDLSDDKVARLPEWPSSALFDERERDCIAFAEQFVMDVGALSDEDAFAVNRHFDASGFYAFVAALYIIEFGQRLEIVSRALLTDAA